MKYAYHEHRFAATKYDENKVHYSLNGSELIDVALRITGVFI